MQRASYSILALLAFALFTPDAAAQQPNPKIDPPQEQVVIDIPGGGKAVISAKRDQLRAGPGTKTARLPHGLRAALEAKEIITPPATIDWTKRKSDQKMLILPMLGNDSKGDCYYVTIVKLPMMQVWMVTGEQINFDTNAVIRRYTQLSGGDNGLSDYQVFPEQKSGVIGPNGPYKSEEQLIIPATDKAAIKLALYAFGPMMYTFTVYDNFSQKVGPNVRFTGSSGRMLGGHAIPISGIAENGDVRGETWAIQPGFWGSAEWVASVDPEFVAVFSKRWFDDKGYAPNGFHYTALAALWNSIGGHVDPTGGFPPPKVAQPTATLTSSATTTAGTYTLTWATTNATTATLNSAVVAANGSQQVSPLVSTVYTLTATGAAGTIPATATVTVDVVKPPDPPQPGKLVPFDGTLVYKGGVAYWTPPPGAAGGKVSRAEVAAFAKGNAPVTAGFDWAALIAALLEAFLKQKGMLADDPAAPQAAPANQAPPPKMKTTSGKWIEQGKDGTFRYVEPQGRAVTGAVGEIRVVRSGFPGYVAFDDGTDGGMLEVSTRSNVTFNGRRVTSWGQLADLVHGADSLTYKGWPDPGYYGLTRRAEFKTTPVLKP